MVLNTLPNILVITKNMNTKKIIANANLTGSFLTPAHINAINSNTSTHLIIRLFKLNANIIKVIPHKKEITATNSMIT